VWSRPTSRSRIDLKSWTWSSISSCDAAGDLRCIASDARDAPAKSDWRYRCVARAEQPRLEAIELYTGSALIPVERADERRTAAAEKGETGQPRPALDAKMETLRLAGGRKDKLRPGDILGALTGEAVASPAPKSARSKFTTASRTSRSPRLPRSALSRASSPAVSRASASRWSSSSS